MRKELIPAVLVLAMLAGCGGGEPPAGDQDEAPAEEGGMVTGTTGAPGPGTVGTPGTPGAPDPDTISSQPDSAATDTAAGL